MSSPFAQKLGTNYCPTDDEVPEIKALLVEPTLKVKDLDDEIAELQKAIDKLIEERDSLVANVEAHRALISPARRLPLDIIQEIFVACLPTHRNCVMSASEAPVLLGRICSAWRSISLSTPRLWASLHVVEPTRASYSLPTFDAKYAQRLETTKMWLGRSGTCPLSLSLESGFDFSENPQLQSDVFVQALMSFSSRWHRIAFTIPVSIMESLSHLTEDDVPILQDITLNERPDRLPSMNSTPGAVQWTSFGIFRGLMISRFSVSRAQFGNITELPLRWSQLIALTLTFFDDDLQLDALTSERALQILSRCPQLQICSLAIYDYTVGSPGEHPIIECPFLHTFELVCGASPAYTLHRMFKRLSLPEFRHFKLRGYSVPESNDMLSFSSFLAVSTQLESLDICTETFSKELLLDLLRDLPPTMQRLQISHVWSVPDILDDDILAILTISDDIPSTCCPGLRQLILSQCGAFSDAALLRFVTSRMTTESCNRLERVEVQSGSREREIDLTKELAPFLDAGLIVSFNYSFPAPLQYSPWLGLQNEHHGPP
ncbi:hypothetical protein DFH07DRAFT_1059019 [Mycena maculata]|uniref:F-box domain-containing protein n=1 Tax=Mycena maculata TaxID=230809 RepID=A0AAD7NKZ6_9AGAR|nr:hypothetical protein DFH07DRAFT_1059019 [Mycena maculata]